MLGVQEAVALVDGFASVGPVSSFSPALALLDPEASRWAQVGVALVLVGAAAVTDLRSGRIPNPLTLAGAVLGLGLSVVSGTLALSVLGGLAGAGALLGVRLLGHVLYRQPGMGWGDVKLAGALGTLMGWEVLWALFLAAVAGSVVGVGWKLYAPSEGPRRMVFAPFIAVGWAVSQVVAFPVLVWS